MTVQLFLDESKRGGFVFAVVAVDAHRVKDRRRWLRGQLLPGQERIHFTDERRTRRQQLIAGIAGWSPPPAVHILTSGNRYQSEARDECIAMLPDLARRTGANLAVIERDDSRYESDRRALTRCLTEQGHPVRWEILRAKDDPLLWSADAMAWCWTNPDPDWRRRIAPLIASVSQS